MLLHHTKAGLPSETDWLVPGIVPYNGLVVLASAPKTGKSCFANAIARALSTGGEFAGMRWDDKFPVAWCAHEETKEERAPLLEGLKPEDPFYVSFPPELPFLDDPDCDSRVTSTGKWKPEAFPYVYKDASEKGVQLLVIDCLHAAVRHSNLAENNVARRIMGKLRRWSNEYKIATIVLHHLTKSAHRGYHPERFADSAQILASASCYFFLESDIQPDNTRRITLHGAGRQPAPPPRLDFDAHSLLDYRAVKPGREEQERTARQKISEVLEDGWEFSAEELARRLDLNLSTVRNTLKTMQNVQIVAKRSRQNRYTLANSEGVECA